MIKTARHVALAMLTLEDLERAAHAAKWRIEGQPGIGADLYREGSDRLAVCLFYWREGRWQRFRRLTGPKPADLIPSEIERAARRLGYPIIGALEQ